MESWNYPCAMVHCYYQPMRIHNTGGVEVLLPRSLFRLWYFACAFFTSLQSHCFRSLIVLSCYLYSVRFSCIIRFVSSMVFVSVSFNRH